MRAGRAWLPIVGRFSARWPDTGRQPVRKLLRAGRGCAPSLAHGGAGRRRAWRGSVRPCAARYVGGGRTAAAAVRPPSGEYPVAMRQLFFF
ncbi:hypothetical protein F511_45800 [Dorcoceras hygrometricum]|uniref:Uncharacterized protein n=1 Tax=Dorcoceras hygrometricum TaxID=472368 RepID=A0A2Z6ZV22_9LAMI|nr:hypothetical protein F511_45800 [Dorcoceras hygrometricum]